jgi:hypothetical protein
MEFSIERGDDRDAPGGTAAPALRSGPVEVGWLLTSNRSSVLYFPPERLRAERPPKPPHAKSAARCPAAIGFESRYFVVRCPVDLNLGFGRTDKGAPCLIDRLGAANPVRKSALGSLMVMTREEEWRHPDRPVVQMKLPYLFIADEPVMIQQMAAFQHYRRDALPGLTIGGRFPIDVWPRALMWAFEWHDSGRDLVLRRGEPLFYVTFETEPANRPVSLVEAERTAELAGYMEAIEGVVNYVNQTFSLFDAAEARRPPRILTRKTGPGGPS